MVREKPLSRRSVIQSVGGTVVGIGTLGAFSSPGSASSDNRVTFTVDVDEYEFVDRASLTIEDRSNRWLVRESVSVTTPADAPLQQYNVTLKSDLLEEYERDGGADRSDGPRRHDSEELPSVTDLKKEAEATLEVETLDENATDAVTSNEDVTTADDTWSGLQLVTASQFCGDLARSQLNVNWEHHVPNPQMQYSEYHDHFFSTWSVDGAECNFPDYDIFATTWHVDDESDTAGNVGDGSIEADGEAEYYNTDFPMPGSGTHYADHTASVDISYYGSVTRYWDRTHEGTYAWVLDKPSVTTW
ncbi:hypothetical protein [Halopiger goleimassiliensis]|uniref:hypothetical protein n=1 Tax=Halopiger goleimassiliensis TaxID=1293048 RepID=UPI000677DEC3|nr:hypothetical protein [Halopiger goleimassiliensis]